MPSLKSLVTKLYLLICAIPGALLWYSPLRKRFLPTLFSPEKSALQRSFSLFVLDILFYTDVSKYRSLIISQEAGDVWCDIYRSRKDTYKKLFSNWFDLLEKIILSNGLARVMQVGCAGGRTFSSRKKIATNKLHWG
jgi:hypothetical protein